MPSSNFQLLDLCCNSCFDRQPTSAFCEVAAKMALRSAGATPPQSPITFVSCPRTAASQLRDFSGLRRSRPCPSHAVGFTAGMSVRRARCSTIPLQSLQRPAKRQRHASPDITASANTVVFSKKPELGRPEFRQFWTPQKRRVSSRQLIADRQPADAFAGRREDGVAKRGRKRRQAWLADAARRHIDAVLDDIGVRYRR